MSKHSVRRGLTLVLCGLLFTVTPVMAQVDFCEGDFDHDGDQDGSDAALFKSDFGRSSMQNPCPACVAGEWCSY